MEIITRNARVTGLYACQSSMKVDDRTWEVGVEICPNNWTASVIEMVDFIDTSCTMFKNVH